LVCPHEIGAVTFSSAHQNSITICINYIILNGTEPAKSVTWIIDIPFLNQPKGNIMQKKLLVVVLGTLFALPAFAEDAPAAPASPITYNVGAVSDYIFRGLTQTTHAPAIQGGVDYAHASGFYLGAWASNIKWIKDSGALASGDAPLELDTYFGIRNAIVGDLGYDVGYVRFNYAVTGSPVPAAGFNSADTAEVYVAATYKFLTLKYSYSLLDGFLTLPAAKGTNYIDLTANYAVGESGVTVGAHIGKQTFVGTAADAFAAAGTDPTYTDYKLSVTKDFSGYGVGLTYTSTNASDFWTYAGDKWGKPVVALSVLHSF
jgi:uncharacterized protein (TIGR02001 family)